MAGAGRAEKGAGEGDRRARVHDALWRARNKDALDEANASVLEVFPAGKRVLEVGCGAGALLAALCGQGREAEGVDLSREAVKRARARGLAVRVWDAEKPLPFKDEAFDVVACVQVLQHLYDPAALVRDMARASRRFVVVNAPNHLWWRHRLAFLAGRFPEDLFGARGHIRLFTPSSLQALVESAGLRVRAASYTGGAPLAARVWGGPATASLWPGLFATSATLVAEKTVPCDRERAGA